jgi:hypothetical protein
MNLRFSTRKNLNKKNLVPSSSGACLHCRHWQSCLLSWLLSRVMRQIRCRILRTHLFSANYLIICKVVSLLIQKSIKTNILTWTEVIIKLVFTCLDCLPLIINGETKTPSDKRGTWFRPPRENYGIYYIGLFPTAMPT